MVLPLLSRGCRALHPVIKANRSAAHRAATTVTEETALLAKLPSGFQASGKTSTLASIILQHREDPKLAVVVNGGPVAPHPAFSVDALGAASSVYSQRRPFDHDRLLGGIGKRPISRKTILDPRDLKSGGAAYAGRRFGSTSSGPGRATNKSQKSVSGLRFSVGTAVECNVGDEKWMQGTIVALDYVEDGWNQPVPYQVKLDNGSLIFAPLDDERVVRKQPKAKARFSVGAAVECNVGDETWMRGTVAALDYVEDGWDRSAPYQVRLDDGKLIFAPLDKDWVIRKQR